MPRRYNPTHSRRRPVFRRRSRAYILAGRQQPGATVFTPPTPAPELGPGINLYVDWNGDGEFDPLIDFTTMDLLTREDISIRSGRDQTRSMSPVGPGEASFLLNNHDRRYSPDNVASDLYPNVIGGKRVQLVWNASPTPIPLYYGFTGDDFEVKAGKSDRSVSVECLDATALLQGVLVSTPLYTQITTGEAIGVILDAVGWPADARDIDTGASSIRWYWLLDVEAPDALAEILNAEGPGCISYTDAEGVFIFRDRNHRATRSRSITSQADWSPSSAVEPAYSEPVYQHGYRDIINRVRFSVEERDPEDIATQVFEYDGTVTLATSATFTLEFDADNPFLDGEVLVPDWVGTGLTVADLTGDDGSPRRTLSITATGGPAVINRIEVWGRAVTVRRTLVVSQEDAASITKYNKIKEFPGEGKWMTLPDAEAIADAIIIQRAERLPMMLITFRGSNQLRLDEQLGRQLSDRVHIVEDESGIDADFFIEQIFHTIGNSGQLLTTTFGCEMAVDVDDPAEIFILGSATNGVLGTNKLAH